MKSEDCALQISPELGESLTKLTSLEKIMTHRGRPDFRRIWH